MYTRRGRSRAQHVRDREADVEGAKSWRVVHLRRSKGEARRAEPTFGGVFSCKSVERRKWRGPKGRAAEPIFGGVWSKTPNSSHRRLAIGCFQGNQNVTLSSAVLFPYIPFQQTVLPPSRALILCAIARKSLKITDFSETGSRNMAETCAINFLTLVSYSTSIVIRGLRRLLLPVLMWAGVDLKYFRPETACWSFRGLFSKFDHPWSIVVGA